MTTKISALPSTQAIAFVGRSQISTPADGNVLLQSAAGGTFGLLQFGGVTSAFPAWRRNGNQLQACLADGSQFTSVAASIFANVPTAVSGLSSASSAGSGARAFVTDATAPTFGATVVGGGAVATPVYSDGTNWKVG